MSKLDRSKDTKAGLGTPAVVIALAMLAALILFAAYDPTPPGGALSPPMSPGRNPVEAGASK